MRQDLTHCSVYFVEYTDAPFLKIGTATDVRVRLSSLRCGHPRPEVLQLVALMPGGVPHEAAIHRRFSRLHHEREWFHFADELRALVADVTAAESASRRVAVAALDQSSDEPYGRFEPWREIAERWGLPPGLWSAPSSRYPDSFSSRRGQGAHLARHRRYTRGGPSAADAATQRDDDGDRWLSIDEFAALLQLPRKQARDIAWGTDVLRRSMQGDPVRLPLSVIDAWLESKSVYAGKGRAA